MAWGLLHTLSAWLVLPKITSANDKVLPLLDFQDQFLASKVATVMNAKGLLNGKISFLHKPSPHSLGLSHSRGALALPVPRGWHTPVLHSVGLARS